MKTKYCSIFLPLIAMLLISVSISYAFGNNSKSVVEKYINAAQKKDYDAFMKVSQWGNKRLLEINSSPKFEQKNVYTNAVKSIDIFLNERVNTQIPRDSKWKILEVQDIGKWGATPMDWVFIEVVYKNGSKSVWRTGVDKKKWIIADLVDTFVKHN